MGKQGTTESSPTGHRTRTSENTIVKVQIFSVGNEITYTVFCSGRIGRILCTLETWSLFVGPCHHGMARPQVADGGTASDMEGSCE